MRTAAGILLVLSCVLLGAVAQIASNPGRCEVQSEWEWKLYTRILLEKHIHQKQWDQDLDVLVRNEYLDALAFQHSEEMAKDGFLSDVNIATRHSLIIENSGPTGWFTDLTLNPPRQAPAALVDIVEIYARGNNPAQLWNILAQAQEYLSPETALDHNWIGVGLHCVDLYEDDDVLSEGYEWYATVILTTHCHLNNTILEPTFDQLYCCDLPEDLSQCVAGRDFILYGNFNSSDELVCCDFVDMDASQELEPTGDAETGEKGEEALAKQTRRTIEKKPKTRTCWQNLRKNANLKKRNTVKKELHIHEEWDKYTQKAERERDAAIFTVPMTGPFLGETCFCVEHNVTNPTAMHIHTGAPGKGSIEGNPELEVDPAEASSPSLDSCWDWEEDGWCLENVLKGNFYLHVHENGNNFGVLRGQISCTDFV
ncbi:hypothetical protein QOT17_002048 [Balamuthia mandrillaris]